MIIKTLITSSSKQLNAVPHQPIISIPVSELESKRTEYTSLQEGDGIGDYDYEQEMDDLNFIFDEAIEAQKDLVIMVY